MWFYIHQLYITFCKCKDHILNANSKAAEIDILKKLLTLILTFKIEVYVVKKKIYSNLRYRFVSLFPPAIFRRCKYYTA